MTSRGWWLPPASTPPEVGTYAARLLDDPLPWTRMRQVYRLLALARRYGAGPVDTACGRALALDVINVTKIASMLEAAVENTPAPLPPPVAAGAARFARDRSRVRPTPLGADPHHRWAAPVMAKASVADPVSVELKALPRALKLGTLPGHPARADHPGQTATPAPR